MSPSRTRLTPLRVTARSQLLLASTLIACAVSLIDAGTAPAATLPTISVAVTPTSVTVGGTLQSGGVNVVSTATGVKEAGVQLVLLKPGVSAAELYTYLESKHKKDINESSKFGSIVFSTEVESGHPSDVQTNLQPGSTSPSSRRGKARPRCAAASRCWPPNRRPRCRRRRPCCAQSTSASSGRRPFITASSWASKTKAGQCIWISR